RLTLDVTSEDGSDGLGNAIPLASGDVVKVFPVAKRVRNTISVSGNVWNPGPQGLTPGMTLSDAIQMAGGLKPDTYLGQVLISRLQPDSTRIQLRATLRDTTGATLND